MLANIVAIALTVIFCYSVLASRDPDFPMHCSSFNCTLNAFGTCSIGFPADLFFNCYPAYCIEAYGKFVSDYKCFLPQSSEYYCSVDGYVRTCHTAYYTYVGTRNSFWVIGVLHLFMRYMQLSIIAMFYIVYRCLLFLAPIAQTKPLYSLLAFIAVMVTGWHYLP